MEVDDGSIFFGFGETGHFFLGGFEEFLHRWDGCFEGDFADGREG